MPEVLNRWFRKGVNQLKGPETQLQGLWTEYWTESVYRLWYLP